MLGIFFVGMVIVVGNLVVSEVRLSDLCVPDYNSYTVHSSVLEYGWVPATALLLAKENHLTFYQHMKRRFTDLKTHDPLKKCTSKINGHFISGPPESARNLSTAF